jgi:hypothetical protein
VYYAYIGNRISPVVVFHSGTFAEAHDIDAAGFNGGNGFFWESAGFTVRVGAFLT